MKQTLLEKAKLLPDRRWRSHKFTADHLELLMAWLNGEVSDSQISHALDFSRANTPAKMGVWAKHAIREGYIKVTLLDYKPSK